MTMRSPPSLPVVTEAVFALPLASFHRATLSPLRVKISAPVGRALVTCFLKTLPIYHLPSACFLDPVLRFLVRFLAGGLSAETPEKASAETPRAFARAKNIGDTGERRPCSQL